MRICAFCPHSAKMSAEDVLPKWMHPLFAGNGVMRFQTAQQQWTVPTAHIDWRAKVVCKNCNNTWMSRIEDEHGKPVLTPLIEGDKVVSIGQTAARSIAIWAFKTAVVMDHAHKLLGQPYFSYEERAAFRKTLIIPNDSAVWVGNFSGHRYKIKSETGQNSGHIAPDQALTMFVFTCAIGCLVIQFGHARTSRPVIFEPKPGFEYIMAPIWPDLYPNLTWPWPDKLTENSQFARLHNRWKTIH
jgi:hypothetical protein